MYIHSYIHTYIHTYTHTYTHTYIHTYIHPYIHTYIHTLIHTYIHMHTIKIVVVMVYVEYLFVWLCCLQPVLVDDSVEACRQASIPALPTLPPLHLPLPPSLISSFLFVSEFLFTFQEQLGLRRRIAGDDLCSMIAGGRGLGEIYRKLLNVRK